jgi:hypothetical protein
MPTTGSRYLALGTIALIVAGCTSDRPSPTELRVPIFEASASPNADRAAKDHDDDDLRHLDTHLKGANENPPNASRARGVAIFKVSKDGSSIDYRLIVAKINNPFQAHIHMAPAGVNGPIVVWLFPSTAPAPGPLGVGRVDGLIAKGTITSANLVGPLAGKTLKDLLDAITNSNTYVNVHTNDGVAPVTNTPGDIPGGEIRGQLGPKQHKEH